MSIQYIADSILIDKIYDLDTVFYKKAGITDDILSGVGGAVSSFVKNNIDTSSTGALLKSVLNLLAPGMFFKIHPILGVVYTAGAQFGFDAGGMLESIVQTIKPKIMNGEQVSAEDINQAGLAIGGLQTEADFFRDLRTLEKNGELLKAAQKAQPLGGSFLGTKGAPLLHKIFGFLGQQKKGAGKSLAAGFIVWFIKTILLSAGLLGVGQGIKAIVQNEPEQEPEQKNETHSVQEQPQGIKYVPIINTPENTLLSWAVGFYPELSGYEDIIKDTQEFKSVLNSLKYEPGKRYIALPPGNTEKSLVNKFYNSAKQKIQEKS